MPDYDREVVVVLGFDVGRKKTGIAYGSLLLGKAHPFGSVHGGRREQLRVIGKQVKEWKPSRLVVGVPVHLDGKEHKMSKFARGFGEAMSAEFGVPVLFADERLTTNEARRKNLERAATRKIMAGRNVDIDAAAACIILQDWMNSIPEQIVRGEAW